jgi:hypothetical protein
MPLCSLALFAQGASISKSRVSYQNFFLKYLTYLGMCTSVPKVNTEHIALPNITDSERKTVFRIQSNVGPEREKDCGI